MTKPNKNELSKNYVFVCTYLESGYVECEHKMKLNKFPFARKLYRERRWKLDNKYKLGSSTKNLHKHFVNATRWQRINNAKT